MEPPSRAPCAPRLTHHGVALEHGALVQSKYSNSLSHLRLRLYHGPHSRLVFCSTLTHTQRYNWLRVL